MNRRDAIKAVMAMPAVARISVAEPKPDDVIVIECDGHVSDETAERLKQIIERVWPGRKAVVLSDGMKLKFAGR